MTFDYNGQTYAYPVTLRDVTLRQRIAWDQEYGKDLAARAAEIDAMRAGDDKDVELALFHIEGAVKSFSFFTGISLNEVEENFDIHQVMAVFETSLSALLQQEGELIPTDGIYWREDLWRIAPPELRADSTVTFNEFLLSKEIVRQMAAIGAGRWEAMPYLCAIYLRKEGEGFCEDLIKDGSERLEMMQDVPMDIAISVAFFLTSTMHIWINTFQSFEKDGAKDQTSQPTLTAGVGSRSFPIWPNKRSSSGIMARAQSRM